MKNEKVINEWTNRPGMTRIRLTNKEDGKTWAKVELPSKLWAQVERFAKTRQITPEEVMRQAVIARRDERLNRI